MRQKIVRQCVSLCSLLKSWDSPRLFLTVWDLFILKCKEFVMAEAFQHFWTASPCVLSRRITPLRLKRHPTTGAEHKWNAGFLWLEYILFRPAPVESVTPSRPLLAPRVVKSTEVNLQNTGKYVLCDVSDLCALLADSHRVRAIFIFHNLRLKSHLKSWTCSSTSTLNIINNESIYYNHFILSFAGACKVIQSCKTCREAQ